MISGSPPSSRPPQDGRLDAARGALRDALGGLRNLEQLLRSIRVGPKALTAVVPDVYASCDTMRSSADTLLKALQSALADDAAARALAQYVEPRVDELETALGAARRRRMNAKNRLVLEELVTRLSRELDTARELIDLLDASVSGALVRIDVAEVVRETLTSGEQVNQHAHKAFEVTAGPFAGGPELLLNPRVGMGLLAIGVVSVCTRHTHIVPHVAVERRPSGEIAVTVGPGDREAARHVLIARENIEPTHACAQAAARQSGARIEQAEDGSRFGVVWPASVASSGA